MFVSKIISEDPLGPSGPRAITTSTQIPALPVSIQVVVIPPVFLQLSSHLLAYSVGRRFNDAKEWQESSIISLPPEMVTLDNEHWIRLARDTQTYNWSPYGAVRHLYDMFYEDDDGDYLRDWFLVEQNVDMQPGCQIWQNGFENDYLWVYNDWKSVCQLQNPTLWDRDPQGSHTGELTTSFSISGNQQGPGFAFTWAYHQPNVYRYDWTDLINQKAQWVLQFDWFSPKRTTEGFQPASSCRVDMPSAAGRYDLTYLYAQAGFKDILQYQGYVYYWWKLWVDYA